jgi:uncharacterized protein YukE
LHFAGSSRQISAFSAAKTRQFVAFAHQMRAELRQTGYDGLQALLQAFACAFPRNRLMTQAIVDPVELRRFVQHLKHFSGEMLNQMQSAQRQLTQLGSTWRDQEHQKFTEEFEQQMRTMSRFVDLTNQYIPFLLRKADRIEEYLQQR